MRWLSRFGGREPTTGSCVRNSLLLHILATRSAAIAALLPFILRKNERKMAKKASKNAADDDDGPTAIAPANPRILTRSQRRDADLVSDKSEVTSADLVPTTMTTMTTMTTTATQQNQSQRQQNQTRAAVPAGGSLSATTPASLPPQAENISEPQQQQQRRSQR